MTPEGLALLVALQIKHLLADYVLQTPYMVRTKGRYGHPGGLLHAGAHGLLTACILALAGFPAALALGVAAGETVIHYHIDWAKERLGRRHALTPSMPGFWRLHGVDQLLHHLTYAGILWLAATALTPRGAG